MKRTNISQVDALFADGSYPIEFLFHYERAFDTKRLRNALRALAPIFWPLFGTFSDGMILFEGYRDEDFFDEEAVDRALDVQRMREDERETYARFHLPALNKLLFMNATRFRNGMTLVLKTNHLAGDGYSYFYFLSALAGISRKSIFPFRPILAKSLFRPRHRRTILREFSFRGERPEPPSRPDTFAPESETISRTDVRTAIREAVSSSGQRISTNDVLSALAMKKMVGRRSEAWGDTVNLTIPIDVRRHIGEYGPRFFGNAILLHTLPLAKADLERSPVKDVAVAIRKSMPAVSKEAYIDYLAGLEKIMAEGRWDALKPFDPDSGCLVTNLSRLPVDKLDFGTGRPDFILPLTVGRNSAGILADEERFILRYSL
ncbi:MAG: acyltransferase [Candidatus Aminicenantales bacterium]